MRDQKKIASDRVRARQRSEATCPLLPHVTRALHSLLCPEHVVSRRLRFELERLGDAPEFVWRDARVAPRLQDVQAFLQTACATLDICDNELLIAVVLLENFLRNTGRAACPHVFFRQLLLICLCLAVKVANDDEPSLYGDAISGLTRASPHTHRRAEAYVLSSLNWTLPLHTNQYTLYLSALLET